MKRALSELSLSLNAVALYGEILGTYIISYVYWFVMTRLIGADALGTVSAMSSFATLIISLMALGIPSGATRFLGKAYNQRQSGEFSTVFISSLIPIGISSLVGVILVVLLRNQLQSLTGLSTTYLYLACVIIFFTAISTVFRVVFICIRRTQVISFGVILGGMVKFGVGIGLVLLGWGSLGAGIGYSVLPVINLVILLVLLVVSPLRFTQLRSAFNIEAAKEVVKAGSVSWLPALILALGTQLGILMVYGTRGAAETGFYFIAYAIFSIVLAIPGAIWGIMFPVLSGMPDSRKRLTWRGIKLGLVITIPVAVCLFLSSKVILSLFGSEFLSVTTALNLLLTSILFMPIARGIETLAYAYGRYRDVLLLGLAANIPRVILYLVLVPTHGATGAAISFLVGSVIGFICSLVVAYRMGMGLLWKQVLFIVSLPVGIGAVIYFLQLHWVLGVLLVLGVSFFGYLMLKIITRSEIQEIISSLYLEPLLRKVWPFKGLSEKEDVL